MSDKFYNDRRPRPEYPVDASVVLTKANVTEANRHIRACTPDHKRPDMERRIRTAAVQRFRARSSGTGDFSSISEYKNFIYGSGE